MIAGLARDDAGAEALTSELAGHLRALLRDVLCGHLDSDVRSLADELLAEAAADVTARRSARRARPAPLGALQRACNVKRRRAMSSFRPWRWREAVDHLGHDERAADRQPCPDPTAPSARCSSTPATRSWSATRDGRIVIANEETERLFGFTREELLGEPIEVLLPQAARERHVAHRDAFMETHARRPMGGHPRAARAAQGRQQIPDRGLARPARGGRRAARGGDRARRLRARAAGAGAAPAGRPRRADRPLQPPPLHARARPA